VPQAPSSRLGFFAYCRIPAVQFTTTVMGADATCSVTVLIRHRRPSPDTSNESRPPAGCPRRRLCAWVLRAYWRNLALQFCSSVIGEAASSSTVLIRKRPSLETSY